MLNEEQSAALELSIQHWERLSSGNRQPGEGVGSNDCALCLNYFKQGCNGCPVSQKTGATLCRKTPYAETQRHKYNLNSPEFKEAAKEELEFLKSLRNTNMNKLTEEEIQSNLRAYEHVMRTGDDKDIQRYSSEDGWSLPQLNSTKLLATQKYRIKPSPKWRAWRSEEVPVVGFLVKGKSIPFAAVVILFDSMTSFLYTRESRHSLLEAFECLLHSTDNGKTWNPCGILE